MFFSTAVWPNLRLLCGNFIGFADGSISSCSLSTLQVLSQDFIWALQLLGTILDHARAARDVFTVFTKPGMPAASSTAPRWMSRSSNLLDRMIQILYLGIPWAIGWLAALYGPVPMIGEILLWCLGWKAFSLPGMVDGTRRTPLFLPQIVVYSVCCTY